jgi:hypothetical protein
MQCLSLYGSTALVDLDRFSSFLIHTQTVGPLGWGISPSQGRYLHIEQHKHRMNAHRQPSDNHASRGIRTLDPSVRVGKDAATVIGTRADVVQKKHEFLIEIVAITPGFTRE